MNKILQKFFTLVIAFVLFLAVLPATNVYAKTASYTVKFRAGDVNTIQIEKLDNEAFEVTENYFAMKVKSGATIREALAEALHTEKLSDASIQEYFEYILKENATYRLSDISEWCEDLDKEISHNESYVMDYKKIVNPIKYTVYFLDTEDRSQIASPWIRYVDGDTEVTEVTVAPLMIKGYATNNTEVRIDLTAEGDKTVEFFYAYVGEYVHVPSGEPGEVIYNDIIHEIIVNAPVVNGEEQPDANQAGQEQQQGQQEQQEQQEQQGESEATQIEDENTPLAPSTEIEDEDVPLYHGGVKSDNVMRNVALVSVGGCALAFLIIAFLVIHNQKKHAKMSSVDKDSPKSDS